MYLCVLDCNILLSVSVRYLFWSPDGPPELLPSYLGLVSLSGPMLDWLRERCLCPSFAIPYSVANILRTPLKAAQAPLSSAPARARRQEFLSCCELSRHRLGYRRNFSRACVRATLR